ncbi:hypothetical protein PRIC1_001137 [Phytophthora ramorum]
MRFLRPKKPPILLCADFDETITQRDTTALLFHLASSPVSLQQQLITQYESEAGAFRGSYELKWRSGRNVRSNFDDAGLREFLDGYATTDLRSLQRVVECRALRGICRPDIVAAAGQVELRADCVETLGTVDEWKVISANWSEELVRSVLQSAGVEIQATQIIANDLKTDERGVSTGEIGVKVQTPVDKARWVTELRETSGEKKVVYVGDSANDLLALLEADVGVWLTSDAASSSSRLLQRLVDNYGIDVHPLTSYESFVECATQRGAGDRPVLFTTTDWSQLRTLVQAHRQNERT